MAGNRNAISSSTGTPTGTFTKNIQFHEKLSVMNPPSVGPMTDDMPNTTPMNPWYLPRVSGGNRSAMAVKLFTIITPPPSPWIARNAISWFIVWLMPASTDPMMNTTIPTT